MECRIQRAETGQGDDADLTGPLLGHHRRALRRNAMNAINAMHPRGSLTGLLCGMPEKLCIDVHTNSLWCFEKAKRVTR